MLSTIDAYCPTHGAGLHLDNALSGVCVCLHIVGCVLWWLLARHPPCRSGILSGLGYRNRRQQATDVELQIRHPSEGCNGQACQAQSRHFVDDRRRGLVRPASWMGCHARIINICQLTRLIIPRPRSEPYHLLNVIRRSKFGRRIILIVQCARLITRFVTLAVVITPGDCYVS